MPRGGSDAREAPVFETGRASAYPLLDEAAQALAAGRYERCLDLTEPLRTPDDEERVQRATLRARAFAGLTRYAEALQVLAETEAPPASPSRLVLETLRGSFLVSDGRIAEGRAHLDRLGVCAAAAPPELRAEIGFERARGAYAAGDLDLAERMLREVDPFPAALGVRGLGLRAWIAYQRNEHSAAEELARTAIARAAIQSADLPVQSRLLGMLAVLAAERLDFGLWSFVEQHAARPELAPFPELAHLVHWGRSVLYEANGQPEEAIDAARHISRSAASEPFALLGRCRRAAVLHRYGERLAHRDLAASIRRQFEALDLDGIRA